MISDGEEIAPFPILHHKNSKIVTFEQFKTGLLLCGQEPYCTGAEPVVTIAPLAIVPLAQIIRSPLMLV